MIIFTFVTLMSGKQQTSASYQRTLGFDTLTDHRTASNKKTAVTSAATAEFICYPYGSIEKGRPS